MKILTAPNPILRQVSKKIGKIDTKTIKFIANLEDTLVKKDDPPGVGLSAAQVGKLLRVFTTFLPKENVKKRSEMDQKNLVSTSYINPTITEASKKLTLGGTKKDPVLEGCLSIPGIYGPVLRHQWIELQYSTIKNQSSTIKKTVRFSGFSARVIQHEMDHLDGILFTDRSIKNDLPVYEDRNGKLHEIELT